MVYALSSFIYRVNLIPIIAHVLHPVDNYTLKILTIFDTLLGKTINDTIVIFSLKPSMICMLQWYYKKVLLKCVQLLLRKLRT